MTTSDLVTVDEAETAPTDTFEDGVLEDGVVEHDAATCVGDSEVPSSDQPGRRHFVARTMRQLRPPRSRRGRILLVAVVVLALVAGVGGYLWRRSERLPAGSAFKVFGHVISVAQLDQEIEALHALYGVQAPTDPAALKVFRQDAAKSYAVSLILDNAAARQNIVIADKAARDTLTKFITQQLGTGPTAHDQFVQALTNAGTSEQAVLTEIKRQLAVYQMFNNVTKGNTVSDQDLLAAFNSRKSQLGSPEQRQISNIVVQTQAQAQQVVADLKGGVAFAVEAQRYSLDASTRSSGGDLGKVSASQLDANYAKRAFAAAPMSVFGPVQTTYGWNVGEVVKVVAGTPAVYAQIKEELRQELLLEKELAVWRTWLGKQIVAAHVRYAPTYRPAHPDAPPVQTAPPSAP